MGNGVGTYSVIFYWDMVDVARGVLRNENLIQNLSTQIREYQNSINATYQDPGEDIN
jgi:hypothetical protein